MIDPAITTIAVAIFACAFALCHAVFNTAWHEARRFFALPKIETRTD